MFQNGPLLIFLGAVFIGVGGILGTLGWTKVSTDSQKRNVVASVIRECESNKTMIDEAITIIKNRDSSSWGFSYRPYKSKNVGMLLTSGLFGFARSEAETIREQLEKYESAIESFNAGLRIVGRHNPGLFLRTEFIHDQEKLVKAPVDNMLSDRFRSLKASTETALLLLSKQEILDRL